MPLALTLIPKECFYKFSLNPEGMLLLWQLIHP